MWGNAPSPAVQALTQACCFVAVDALQPTTLAVSLARVSMKPGATTISDMPRGRHSSRKASDSRITAALLAEYMPLEAYIHTHTYIYTQ